MRYCCLTLAAVAILAASVVFGPPAEAQGKKIGPDAKVWNEVVGKAFDYLKDHQDDNGGWTTKKTPGITGIVLTGMLETGKVTADDPVAAKALKYIESLVNVKEKHIAGNGPDVKIQLKNYVTSINVMALVAAKRADKYKAIIGDAVEFLKQLQWDEGEGKKEEDSFYGGAGYDSSSRPDLSNTQFFLEALKAAGVPSSDPAFKKAEIFVSRAQNFESEKNKQPWAGKINDGSFIYTPAGGGVTKVEDKSDPNVGIPGYGSMTYAGIKSLIYCGANKNDPRIEKAFDWIKKHYTVEENPGMPGVRKEWGLYYYYHTMAKTLDVMGIDYVTDSKGVKHDWRKDITQALAKRQHKDGSWTNEPDRWMEGDPNLVTGYALMALSHCKPKD